MQITQCNDERRSFRWTIIVISNYPTALSKLLMIFNVEFLCFWNHHEFSILIISIFTSHLHMLLLNLMDSQGFRIDHLYIKNKVLIVEIDLDLDWYIILSYLWMHITKSNRLINPLNLNIFDRWQLHFI